jgi:hypothetical protein
VAGPRWHALAEIRRLLGEDTTRSATRSATRQWRALAERKLPELDQHIAQVQALRRAVADCLACGCMNFERCLLLTTHDRRAVEALGVKAASVRGPCGRNMEDRGLPTPGYQC